MTIKGYDAFLECLSSEGVDYLFGNPGTTELAIMEAVGKQSDIEYILGLQENIVVAMADGYARASGSLAVANVHVAPGLGNAMGSIYNAKFFGSPVLITAGQQEQGHGLTEPMLYDPLVPIAQPLVKWAIECTRIQDLPLIIHRAAKIALTPPMGPVFLSLPGDVLDASADIAIGRPTRINTQVLPNQETLNTLALAIIKAKNPAIVAGHEVASRDALEEAGELALTMGAPVFQQTIPYSAQFKSEHPTFLGALSRNQKICREQLETHDLVVFLGSDVLRMSVFSEIDPLPSHIKIVQIGERDWELGKNYPAELAIRANVKETTSALIKLLRNMMSDGNKSAAAKRLMDVERRNWSSKKIERIAQAQSFDHTKPINTLKLMMELARSIPNDCVVIEEALSSSVNLLNYLPLKDHQGYFGLASGGIGFAMAGAIGVSLALPDRPIVALVGDGSSMYSIQALWTAAHLKRPITYVIPNNQGYKILKQRLMSFRGTDKYIGMNITDPAIDYVKLSESMGVPAIRIEDPCDLNDALTHATRSNKTNLIEVMVSTDINT
ncbi:thiamine pyrophosphate-binding protein [Burkholderiales bacterium]|nr:thiamine pyrophosphate-binding protein [Burkholderiales bacterium]